MRNLDLSSRQAMPFGFVGIALVTLIGVVIRPAGMRSVRQRRDRENRQINGRLRTLVAAYKTLGGSFAGGREVDPRHGRDLKDAADAPAGDRTRRIRDAAEAALSDIILPGTEVRLGGKGLGALAGELHPGIHRGAPVPEEVRDVRGGFPALDRFDGPDATALKFFRGSNGSHAIRTRPRDGLFS